MTTPATDAQGTPPRRSDPDRGDGDRRPRAPIGQALLAMVLALLLGALMNADSLADTAERQPFGWQRSTAVAATRPLELVAGATRLDRVNAWLTDGVGGWLRQDPGRDAATAASGARSVRPETGASSPEADGDAGDVGPSGPHPASPGAPARAAQSTGSEAEAGTRRRPTPEAPLEVWLTGDSLVESIGAPLDGYLNGRVPATVRTDPNYATGLARPDYFDWHAYAEESLAENDPDVVIVMMGGNDDQDIREADGQVLRHDEDEWEQEYRRRAVGLLDRLATDARDVFWIGLPIVADAALDERMRRLDAIYREATEAHPRAHYVATRDLFTVDGGYASYLELPDGSVERVRRDDGLHLTPAGGRVLVERRLGEAIAERWSPEP